MADLSQQYLIEAIDYNPETGCFTWKDRPRHHFNCDRGFKMWNARYSGSRAGFFVGDYVSLCIDNITYCAHRLAWLYIHGSMPNGEIDHINGIRDDNRITNLRDVTKSENLKNKRPSKKRGGAPIGIYWVDSRKKWEACIKVNG